MRRILIDDKIVETEGTSYGLPWYHDANCFNVRLPEESILSRNVNTLSGNEEIEGIFIGCELEDYSFLKDMTNLKQLYIYTAEGLEDIEFIENMTKLRHLCIYRSNIKEIAPLEVLLDKQKKIHEIEKLEGKCWIGCFCHAIYINSSTVLNYRNGLEKYRRYISELILNDKRIV